MAQKHQLNLLPEYMSELNSIRKNSGILNVYGFLCWSLDYMEILLEIIFPPSITPKRWLRIINNVYIFWFLNTFSTWINKCDSAINFGIPKIYEWKKTDIDGRGRSQNSRNFEHFLNFDEQHKIIAWYLGGHALNEYIPCNQSISLSFLLVGMGCTGWFFNFFFKHSLQQFFSKPNIVRNSFLEKKWKKIENPRSRAIFTDRKWEFWQNI